MKEEAKIGVQLVEPHNHRVNAAERAIRTYKSHFIAGLCTCDDDFPLVLWPQLVPQAQDSLNMLRRARTHPKLSAYHVLEGVHDYNRVPFAPPGTKATVFNPPEIRDSWEPRALDAWYVGPAYDHYRCWKFFIRSTGGYRISGQANFYPQHCQLPIEKPWDEIKRVAMDLRDAIMKMKEAKEKKPRRQIEALQKLSDIFNVDLEKEEQQYMRENFSSSAPTSKKAVRAAPRVHGRVTRNNKPGIIPTSEGGGKRRRTEDNDWSLTKAEQERINEYKWNQVPTYEGGRKSLERGHLRGWRQARATRTRRKLL